METIFFFKNMTKEEETKLRDYFLTKVPAIERMLSHFPEDAVTLQVKGEAFQKHSAYDVELTMKSPLGTFVSKEASHMITKAVDLSKDRLMMQLKKSILHFRRSHRSIRAKNKFEIRTRSARPAEKL